MSIVNDTNYVNQVPVAADYTIFVRDSDGVLKTATMQQLADLFQSLSSLNLTPVVYSSAQVLADEQFVVANSGGVFNLTLPASSLNSGRGFRIFNKGTAAVTILPNGADTIAGAASLVLAQYDAAYLVSDGLGMYAVFQG
jgi:hypothetical protein